MSMSTAATGAFSTNPYHAMLKSANLSSDYGISIETLKAIQLRQDRENINRQRNEEVLLREDTKKHVEALNSMACQINSLMQFKNVNCMML